MSKNEPIETAVSILAANIVWSGEQVENAYRLDVEALANIRAEIRELVDKVADFENQLDEQATDLWRGLLDARETLTDTRKAEKALADTIRVNAKVIKPTHPALKLRRETVVNYLRDHALKLAAIFLPAAITLNEKMFNSWAVAEAPKNPALLGYISIEQVEGYTIATDLTEYETPDEPDDDVPF